MAERVSTAQRIGTFEPNSAEWHAARATGIGASEIAAVLGLSPWESRFSIWHRKAGNVGLSGETELTTWGHYLEEPIARRFADEHPELRVRRTGTWRSRMRPWQLANPDRLAYLRPYAKTPGTRCPVEVKWSPHADGWGKSGGDEIPLHYRCQVLWQMDVLGAEHGYVAALVGSEYREYRIDYDPVDVEHLRGAGAEFMATLELGVQPDIDDADATYQVLKQMHPEIEDRTVEIRAMLAGEYRGRLDALEHATKAAKRVKNEVLAAMGTARYAECLGELVARRQPGAHGSIALHQIKPDTEPKSIREAVPS